MGRNLIRRIRWGNVALATAGLAAIVAVVAWGFATTTTPVLPGDTPRPLVPGATTTIAPVAPEGDEDEKEQRAEQRAAEKARGEGARGGGEARGGEARGGEARGGDGPGRAENRGGGQRRAAPRAPAATPVPSPAPVAPTVVAPAPRRATPTPRRSSEFGFEGAG